MSSRFSNGNEALRPSLNIDTSEIYYASFDIEVVHWARAQKQGYVWAQI